ncbi:hypothetical protein [Streptococcus ovuberis]|uniref:Uncharacterized protein n=1 Tax=Streptococcus ovuberis TaxID=1936207 RepID=A0A7X6MWL1_9STRE|nr:hypothetical protein [Streptococcus ovuberis]NKZ19710.1 hypothetical protein [Streptococcus ovuberis]
MSNFTQIKELMTRLPVMDGVVVVDEFGEYKEMAIELGLGLTEYKGKLAYKINIP